jgi:peptide methionine sulfoxide reductase MsrB
MLIRNGRTGLPVHDYQYRTDRTELQCRTVKAGLLGHEFRDRTVKAVFVMIES